MADFRRLPTLTQLRHLLSLEEHRHFGRAAAACFVTQSTLSASIKELEVTLGQQIMERGKRRVLPTPIGEAVIARARNIINDTEDLVDLVKADRLGLSGPLRLGVIPTISPFLLPRVLPELRKTYPDLRLYLEEAQTASLIRLLRQGDLDLILMAFPYDCIGLHVWEFALDSLWVVLPEGHPLTKLERVQTSDVVGEELMLLRDGHCLRDHVLSSFSNQDVKTISYATSLSTLVQMVANGLGITLLPKMALDGGLLAGTRLQSRPLDGSGGERRIGICWRPSSPRASDFRILGGFFRDELATPIPI